MNKNVQDKLIKVCNPYCGPYSRSHFMIEKLLKEVDDVSVQVIFTTPPDIADTKYAPTRHFLAISAAAGENQDQIDLALDDWYRSADKNYEAFAKRYPVKDLENTVYKMEIQAMNERCQTVSV